MSGVVLQTMDLFRSEWVFSIIDVHIEWVMLFRWNGRGIYVCFLRKDVIMYRFITRLYKSKQVTTICVGRRETYSTPETSVTDGLWCSHRVFALISSLVRSIRYSQFSKGKSVYHTVDSDDVALRRFPHPILIPVKSNKL